MTIAINEALSGIPIGTIREAFRFVCEFRWKGLRSERQNVLIGREIVLFLTRCRHRVDMDEITTSDVGAFVAACRARGNSPATIWRKLTALTTLGTEALRHSPPLATRRPPTVSVANPKLLKWWLRPEEHDRLVAYLDACGEPLAGDFVRFVCLTGLRIEEALRLRASHFVDIGTDHPSLTVPGTKRSGSQATIPISVEAAGVAVRCIGRSPDGRLFPTTYRVLMYVWKSKCKPFLGVEQGDRMATLRALRRTFGKLANDRGMPTSTLQGLYRHESIKTTEGYLRLVGDVNMEAARKWL